MSFSFPVLTYILAMISDAFLIFFSIFHVSSILNFLIIINCDHNIFIYLQIIILLIPTKLSKYCRSKFKSAITNKKKCRYLHVQ